MKILIIGGGGREHALAWKISQSPSVSQIFVSPGNGGTEWAASSTRCASKNVALSAESPFTEMIKFAKSEEIDLTVVGPELPLAAGIVDYFEVHGLTIFGPTQAAAQLEASKAFSKDFMEGVGIPTAAFGVFRDKEAALAYLDGINHLVVVKASGLAAGKGVIVCDNHAQARQAIIEIMEDRRFGASGDEVVIEERLEGPELSLLAISDGKTAYPLLHSRDHKRVFDDDQGPNTGGMGAYGPVPEVPQTTIDQIMNEVVYPAIQGMANQGTPYIGILYAGLMLTPNGLKTLEFNCRFGDPETQVVLPMLENDLVELMLACCNGELDAHQITNIPGACATIVMASPGYPGSYPKGLVISGVEQAEEGAIVFQAGTKRSEKNGLQTSGGRVLAVTGRGNDLNGALANAYAGVEKISFEGAHFRKDIGGSSLP